MAPATAYAFNALPTLPVTFAPVIDVNKLPLPLKKLAVTKLPKSAFSAVKFPVELNVPVTLTPVPVTITTLPVPPTPIVMLPLAVAMSTLLVPFAVLVAVPPEAIIPVNKLPLPTK